VLKAGILTQPVSIAENFDRFEQLPRRFEGVSERECTIGVEPFPKDLLAQRFGVFTYPSTPAV
jgi:hypothetical protein